MEKLWIWQVQKLGAKSLLTIEIWRYQENKPQEMRQVLMVEKVTHCFQKLCYLQGVQSVMRWLAELNGVTCLKSCVREGGRGIPSSCSRAVSHMTSKGPVIFGPPKPNRREKELTRMWS